MIKTLLNKKEKRRYNYWKNKLYKLDKYESLSIIITETAIGIAFEVYNKKYNILHNITDYECW